MSNCLIIFAKNLEPGKVKTRLAKDIGDEQALKVYESLLKHTHAITKDLNCAKYLFYSNKVEADDLWRGDYSRFVQEGSELGTKMKHAFKQAFKKHGKAVIIGSDCYDLSSDEILEAFKLLDKNDFVIGPTRDGGYYLLGMKAPNYYVFENIQYSHGEVTKQTIDKILSKNHSLTLIKQLTDIDTVADLESYPQLIDIVKA